MNFNMMKKTLLKLWKLLSSMNVVFYFILKFYHWSTNELLLIENQNQYIQSKQIHNHVLNIQFCKQNKFIDFSLLHVHRVFNLFKNQFRVIDFLLFIWNELKLQQYDHEYLTSRLTTNIQLFFLIIFIDDFEFYRYVCEMKTNILWNFCEC